MKIKPGHLVQATTTNQNSTATLSPEVYIFKKEGEFKQNSTLNISPAGTVEMYFKKKWSLKTTPPSPVNRRAAHS